jgi:hypothetical protein
MKIEKLINGEKSMGALNKNDFLQSSTNVKKSLLKMKDNCLIMLQFLGSNILWKNTCI